MKITAYNVIAKTLTFDCFVSLADIKAIVNGRTHKVLYNIADTNLKGSIDNTSGVSVMTLEADLTLEDDTDYNQILVNSPAKAIGVNPTASTAEMFNVNTSGSSSWVALPNVPGQGRLLIRNTTGTTILVSRGGTGAVASVKDDRDYPDIIKANLNEFSIKRADGGAAVTVEGNYSLN